jgi:dsRNA-specific ribonuclease
MNQEVSKIDDEFEISTEEIIAKGQGYVDTLLSNINLQRVCEESGISRYINLNPSTQGIVPPRLKSDTIEAIFAAVAEDGAASGRPNALRTVMQNLGLLP